MTQEKALEILKSGKNVFLTGEPGSGKTYTINQFVEACDRLGKSVAVTASTGIAATHIDGITIHSWCAMGIKEIITDRDIANIMTKPYAVRHMTEADVLIIDEISMLGAQAITNIDMILKNVRGNGFEPFGGMQVIFVGDFFQLPPVTKKGEPMFAFESEAWKAAEPVVCYLTEQHRQSDKEFLEILSAMRMGTIEDRHIARLLECRNGEPHKTKLFTHNVSVDAINMEELQKIDGEERHYRMTSNGIPFLVDLMKRSCMSPELLTLRVGAIVMFTKNNFDAGYVNGTLGTVVRYDHMTNTPIVETEEGIVIRVLPAQWKIEDGHTSITQIPLRLAWAITVHKSQGMSLDSATIDLSKCFEDGQGYVALSRVRSLAGIFLEGLNKKTFAMSPKVVAKDAEFREQSAQNENAF